MKIRITITGFIVASIPLGAAPAADSSYAIVDTGQAACYDASDGIAAPPPGASFAGQDAHYAGNPAHYTLSGDDLTVYDSTTGLTWQQSPDTDGDGDIDVNDKLTWTGLQAYPASLNAANYGGYNDWRLPSIKELYSLIDFRGIDPPPEGSSTAGLIPFIDTNYFGFAYGDTAAGERIIDSQWGSSTLYVADNNTLFGVNFADGRIKGYGLTLFGRDKTFLVFCCRGNTDYGHNRFVDTGDGTVCDLATGLTWQQGDSGYGMNWEDALAYAENLELNGYRDWRLPNAKELQSIVDYTRSPDTTASAAIDPLFTCSSLTNMAGEADYPFYWTGTTHVSGNGSAGRAAYVVFGRGLGQIDGSIVDIHGAGCQRSDPKDGNPANYPSAGNGPQGDVSRVFNHVRCVRGGASEPVADADGDGLTDWYEYNYAQNTTGMVASVDLDGDGASNGDEAAAGTIPTDEDSVLRIEGVWQTSSSVVVNWTSELGKTYSLLCSTNLVADAFPATLGSGIAGTASVASNTSAPPNTVAFYRVVVE